MHEIMDISRFHEVRRVVDDRPWRRLGVLLVLAAAGCGSKGEHQNPILPPAVDVIQPRPRTITIEVGQPSFVESYERTSIFPKLTGYIKKWNVDIGDKLKKGDVLCTLFVPELEEDYKTKKAAVVRDEEKVRLALQNVEVCSANVESAKAQLAVAKSILTKYESEVERWQSEADRLAREVKRGVVDPQVLSESQNQLRSNRAAQEAAQASIQKANADLLAQKATLAQANVAVAVARADLAVAQSDARRLEAWVGYLTITAPYNGVVVARNANTGDFVLPAAGDPTANTRSPHLSPGDKAAPIYVVERTDVVRIFVDVPEHEANFVTAGTKARVLCRGYRDRPIPAAVTRTSWALNVKSRTLRAEIDLKNTDGQIRPGMYAYGTLNIECPGVWALPETAVVVSGDKMYYWRYVKDEKDTEHAVRTEVETGVSDGNFIQVLDSLPPGRTGNQESWAPINGSEEVIEGADLSPLGTEYVVRRRSPTDGVASARK